MPNNGQSAVSREEIDRFARTISRQPIGLAKYAPEPWAEIRMCFDNARRKVAQDGGRAQCGWMFQHKWVPIIPGPGYLVAIHHAVWHAPNGYLFDVTPLHPNVQNHPLALDGDTLFLVDDAAQPVCSGLACGPLPSKFFALDDDERLVRHVQRLHENEEEYCRNIYGQA